MYQVPQSFLEILNDVAYKASIEGLRGNVVTAVIPPQTAASSGYTLCSKKYVVGSASSYDVRNG